MVRCRAFAWELAALAAAIFPACASAPAGEEAELPETTALAPETNTRFVPEDSASSAADSGAKPELPGLEVATSDLNTASDSGSDADAGSAPDSDDTGSGADSGPETKPPVTTCEGHCGIYMEDNPCHCSVLCLNEGSCCPGFQELCKCGKDSDCDDGNDCTTDSCNKGNGFCFQQPLKSCCQSDSECPPGDECNIAKCIAGTCTKQPKDCNDGLDCTLDYCEKGACVNKTNAKNCLIDGKCLKAGDQDPNSGGCASCDPAKKQDQWTAKAGKCSIDGNCVDSGAANPAAACAVCNTAKSSTAWSATSGNCFIDGKCYKANEVNPADACQLCDPASSQSAWSGKAGFCSIDGKCVADKTANPADACQVCDTTKTKAGWSAKAGYCSLDGQCVANGKSATGSGGCKICDATKPTAWTLKAEGTACTSTSTCLTNNKCTAAGECAGTQKPGCCVTDNDCANDPTIAPGPCEQAACDPANGKCGVKATPQCCTSGVCCDVANKAFQPKGTACGTFKLDQTFECDGDAGYAVDMVAGCTGLDPSKCSSSILAQGTKTKKIQCGADEVCTKVNDTSFKCVAK